MTLQGKKDFAEGINVTDCPVGRLSEIIYVSPIESHKPFKKAENFLQLESERQRRRKSEGFRVCEGLDLPLLAGTTWKSLEGAQAARRGKDQFLLRAHRPTGP